MATPDYSVNYDDKRFTEVEADKKAALNEIDTTYGNMISNSDKFYQQQIDASKQYAEQQKKFQQEQTDFAIEQINQQKEQAKKDYTKEQSGAYVDWQKQSNQYGANAEAMAAQGMQNTGYSESSQVSMYTTYQNRVATARESYSRAVLNYDNAIKDARLQNNAALAEIAYNALQKQLELSIEGFQYKNTLIIAKSDKELAVDDMYYGRYQDVLQQINTEAQMAFEREKFEYQKAQDELARKAAEDNPPEDNPQVKRYVKSTPTYKPVAGAKKGTTTVADSKEPVVDMNSVKKVANTIGTTALSPSQLNTYVSKGLVQERVINGRLTYTVSPVLSKLKKLYNNQ